MVLMFLKKKDFFDINLVLDIAKVLYYVIIKETFFVNFRNNRK